MRVRSNWSRTRRGSGPEEPALQVRGWVYAALARPGDTGDGMVERLRRGAALAAAAGSLPTRMLAELALARLLAGEGRPEAAARLLTELRASLTEHPIPLLELECHRIGAEAGLPGYGPEGESAAGNPQGTNRQSPRGLGARAALPYEGVSPAVARRRADGAVVQRKISRIPARKAVARSGVRHYDTHTTSAIRPASCRERGQL
jgi:hypothetical protein